MFARSPQRLFASCALFVVALVLLLSSQHRLRLAFGSFKTAGFSEFATSPVHSQEFRFAPVTQSALSGSFQNAVQFLRDLELQHPLQAGDPLPISDDPDSCIAAIMTGRPVHCYNVDIGVVHELATQGFYSRMWDIAGSDGLGGFGHNLLEVWDAPSASWKAIDPYYHCYYARGDTALAVLEARSAILGRDTSVHFVKYVSTTFDRPSSDLIPEFRFLAPAAMLHTNNDFSWRYEHRYGMITFLAPLLDRLPLRTSRGIRTLFLSSDDGRLVIDDHFSPHYRAWTYRYGALLLLLLALVTGGLGVIATFRSLHRPVVVGPSPARKQTI